MGRVRRPPRIAAECFRDWSRLRCRNICSARYFIASGLSRARSSRNFSSNSRSRFQSRFDCWAKIADTNNYFIAALNNESLEINEYRIDTFHLRNYFDAFFSSCYLGVRKPDAGIYHRALSITHRKPAECIFIDDRGLNLECAKELGMHVIHFRNADQLRDALAERGVSSQRKIARRLSWNSE